MAFHNHLSLTQRTLLAIFCFPLVPFYLCYVCFCASEDKNGNDDNQQHKLERKKKARTDGVDGHSDKVVVEIEPRKSTPKFQTRVSFGKGKEVTANEAIYENEVVVEIEPRKSTPKLQTRVSFGKGKEVRRNEAIHENEVVVEIEPRKSTPKLQTRVSFGKGKEVKRNEATYENKGFVGDDFEIDRKTEYAFPWDKSNLKSMCIDLDKLKHIDAYASKVKAGDSVEALVQQLLKGTKSDMEKLRAIWMWVTHHIEYDVVGLQNSDLRSGSPSDVLKTGKGVCAGYAGLFHNMCSFAGIECQQVSGYSKGAGYQLGARFTGDGDHAWNAVRLAGTWHLLDSTWGAGNVGDNLSVFKFEYNEFYFLTHPALFVGEHFPLERQWQLLNPQLSLKQFENAMHLRSMFYNVGLLSLKPETYLLQSDGKTTITVKSSSPVMFMHNMNGKQCDAIMTLTPDGMKLDVYPQKTGKHSLEIYAKASNSGEKYSQVCEYQLQCKTVNKEMKVPDDLSNPVGPSWLTERKGLQQPSQHSHIVYAPDGRCSFSFRVASHLNLMAMLNTAAFSMTDDDQRRHVFQSRREDSVNFRVQVPRAGLYVFKIYGNEKSETGSYEFLCNYLISCTNPTVRWPLYPLMYGSWKKDYELVEPLSGVLPANRTVNFKMRIPKVSKVSVGGRNTQDLVLDSDGYWSGCCSTAGCTDLNVMIQVNPGDRSLSFILNYQVESH